jgi:hypothetical protein
MKPMSEDMPFSAKPDFCLGLLSPLKQASGAVGGGVTSLVTHK